MNKMLGCLFAVSFLAAGCATPVYREVLRERPAYNKKEFPVSKDILYDAAVKAICSKSFILEKEDKEEGFILAKRYFQRGKKNIVLALQAKMTRDAENKTTLYLNAVETTENLYIADRTRFFLFIIPLPGGGGKEATKIKEGERAVEDKKFYKQFFSIIEKEAAALGNM